jgi:cysteine desulfurase
MVKFDNIIIDMKQIYFDNAATTPVDLAVKKAMLPYFDKDFANPSSFHSAGKRAKDAIEQSRLKISRILNCKTFEIIFTMGGTESDNLAVLGACRAHKERGNHIISTFIEHHAVLEPISYLARKEGFKVDFLSPSKGGIVSAEKVAEKLNEKTVLVSVMYANNEIGTILPIKEIGEAIRKFKIKLNRKAGEPPFFHTDACQAAGYLELDVGKLGVDLMTLNGSKIYGPKGTGLLYLKNGVRLEPIIFGGGQERALRPGTENVPSIVGLSAALELANKKRVAESKRLCALRDYLIEKVKKTIPAVSLNGHPTERLPNNINLSFKGIEGESLVLYLDAKGIYASTGSACSSISHKSSYVLKAIGVPQELAHGSLRITLGRQTTKSDIDYFLKVLPPIVKKLRDISAIKIK